MKINWKIAAVSYISVSEIQKVMPEFTWEYFQANKRKSEDMLYELGLDLKEYPYEIQNSMHRNRFDEIVDCVRFVGNERTDKQWVNSGYASIEAIDKASGNKLLVDIYRKRGQFETEEF